MLAIGGGVCKYAPRMADDLIPTKAAAALLGVTVATVNRWANEKKIEPAIKMDGTTGARLYRRSDIEALRLAEAAS